MWPCTHGVSTMKSTFMRRVPPAVNCTQSIGLPKSRGARAKIKHAKFWVRVSISFEECFKHQKAMQQCEVEVFLYRSQDFFSYTAILWVATFFSLNTANNSYRGAERYMHHFLTHPKGCSWLGGRWEWQWWGQQWEHGRPLGAHLTSTQL